ncbi:MAG: hypothetical protein ACRCUJ_13830 [Phocaeicola sp.]
MIKDKLPLSTLCLITTHQCTSSCPNCGFFCSPKLKVSMKMSDMVHYIEKALQLFPSINCLVLTGGEVSCFPKSDICKVIAYARTLGISNVRIVSNGVWAKSVESAFAYLSELKNSGLTELNISTGDEHSLFVPLPSVINAIKVVQELGIHSTIALEKHKKNRITSQTIKDEFKGTFGTELSCQISESPWIEMRNFRKKYTDEDFDEEIKIHGGCSSLFTGIQINPSGQLLACCGFAAEFSEHLKLGHIDSYSSREQYEENVYNLLTLWLYSEGPMGIVEHIIGKGIKESSDAHMCEHCLRLLKLPNLQQTIESVEIGKLKEIEFKYEANRARQISSLNKQLGMDYPI